MHDDTTRDHVDDSETVTGAGTSTDQSNPGDGTTGSAVGAAGTGDPSSREPNVTDDPVAAVREEYETLVTGITAITSLFTRPGASNNGVDRDVFLDAVRSARPNHLAVLIGTFAVLTAGVVLAAWAVAGIVTESIVTRPFVTVGVLVLFERVRVSLAA